MNEVAERGLALGVPVVGVIPENLVRREAAHRGLTELLVVSDMLERKALMAKRSDVFVAIPGGIGTYDEIFEMLTWRQLRVHAKPCGVLNVEGYFQPLLDLVQNAVRCGFLAAEQAKLLHVETEPSCLLGRLFADLAD